MNNLKTMSLDDILDSQEYQSLVLHGNLHKVENP